jgi:LmbE family N-acetylglucosaminyl deacetylase
MATAVFFHAHPDDEALFTGGTMARAAAEGHRVVLVTATKGERGLDRSLVADPILRWGESGPRAPDPVPNLGPRREAELRVAAGALGVARLHFLGYQDSGIDGDGADGFSAAPAEEAAQRLAAIIVEESAEVLVTYDERGIYGHPDHLQVHKVGLRAAQLADVASVFLATVDRDRLQAMLHLAESFGLAITDDTLDWAVSAGVAADRITTSVDVDFLDAKRQALAAHQTQFPPGTGLLELPPTAFQVVFGTEWYIELGAVAGSAPRSWLWDSSSNGGAS